MTTNLTARQRDRIKTLRRRRDFLVERVANYREDGNPSHDIAELGALNWAIRIVENCAGADILKEVE